MYADAARDLWRWAVALVRGDFTERVSIESRLCYFLGYAWERQRERWQSVDIEARPPMIPPRARTAN
jgi:hypothetical protein